MAFGDDNKIAVQLALFGAKEFAAESDIAAESLVRIETAAAEAGATATVAGSRFTAFSEKIGMSGRTAKMSILPFHELKHAVGGFMAVFIGYEAIHSSIEVTEKLTTVAQKLADQYGMTTASALKWASATQILGIEPRSLMMGFTTLSKGMAKAKEGSDLQIRAFNTLGISMSDVKAHGHDIGGMVTEITKRLGKHKLSTDEAAAATILLGRGYQTLGPIMMDHGKVFDRMSKTLDRYFKGKNLEEMEKMRMAQVDYKTALFELQITLAEEVIPTLIKAFHAMADFVDEGEKGHGVAGRLVDIYHALGDVVSGVYGFFAHHQTTFKILAYSILGAWAAIKLFNIGMGMWVMGSKLVTGVGIGIRFLQWNFAVLGLTMELLPFVAIFTAAFALGVGIGLLVNHFGGWHQVMINIKDWFVREWPLLVGIILAPFTFGMSMALPVVMQHWGSIESWLASSPDRLKGFMGEFVQDIVSGFAAGLQQMEDAWNKFQHDITHPFDKDDPIVKAAGGHNSTKSWINDHLWGGPEAMDRAVFGDNFANREFPKQQHRVHNVKSASVQPLDWGGINENMAGGGVTIHSHLHVDNKQIGESMTTWRKNQAARR